MDGLKTSVCARGSDGRWRRMMLRVLLCRGWERGDVLCPHPEPSGEVAGGDPAAFAALGCPVSGVSAGLGICHPVAAGELGGSPTLRLLPRAAGDAG